MLRTIPPTRSRNAGPSSLTPVQIRKVTDAVLIIEAHTHEKVSLHCLSRQVLMCPSDLQRAFRALVGYPIGKYGKLLRIQRAKELLLEHPETPVYHIAFEVGYADGSSLPREFRKTTGLSPGQFREKFAVRTSTLKPL